MSDLKINHDRYVLCFVDGPRKDEKMIYPTLPGRYGGYCRMRIRVDKRTQYGYYYFEKESDNGYKDCA